MGIHEKFTSIETKEDLADFLDALSKDYIDNSPDEDGDVWENRGIGSCLCAMRAFTNSIPNAYKNRGETFPNMPTWKIMGNIFYSAKFYE